MVTSSSEEVKVVEGPIDVLIVEDDASIRESLRSFFGGVPDIRATFLESGYQGMKAIDEIADPIVDGKRVHSKKYDVFLFDYMLAPRDGEPRPAIDGIDLGTYLNTKKLNIPWILLTAMRPEPEMIRRINKTHNFVDYLMKPPQWDALVQTMRQAKRRRKRVAVIGMGSIGTTLGHELVFDERIETLLWYGNIFEEKISPEDETSIERVMKDLRQFTASIYEPATFPILGRTADQIIKENIDLLIVSAGFDFAGAGLDRPVDREEEYVFNKKFLRKYGEVGRRMGYSSLLGIFTNPVFLSCATLADEGLPEKNINGYDNNTARAEGQIMYEKRESFDHDSDFAPFDNVAVQVLGAHTNDSRNLIVNWPQCYFYRKDTKGVIVEKLPFEESPMNKPDCKRLLVRRIAEQGGKSFIKKGSRKGRTSPDESSKTFIKRILPLLSEDVRGTFPFSVAYRGEKGDGPLAYLTLPCTYDAGSKLFVPVLDDIDGRTLQSLERVYKEISQKTSEQLNKAYSKDRVLFDI